MSGHWPPSGADPGDEEFIEQAGQPGAEAASRLSAVSAFLATAPDPVMPDIVGARISAALAAESAARAADPARAVEGPLADRAVLPEPRHRRKPRAPRRRLQGAGRRILTTGPVVLVVCLALVGLGYLLARSGSSDSSGPSSSGAPAGSSARAGLNSAAAGPATEPGSARQSSGVSGGPTPFNGTDSGTSYSRATLASQVEAELRAPSSATAPRPLPEALRGCVLHFTGGSPPALVDRGSYQGTAAYVIASTSHVWVVGLGCTATKPELIESATLAG